jgi:tetratricopeptide (TPR) repeat protein
MELRSEHFVPTRNRGQAIDNVLWWASILLAAAVLFSVAYLGYTIWNQRAIERAADPAARAIETFYADVEAAPADPKARIRLGEALASTGRYDEAVRELNVALELEPEHTGAHLVLGIVAILQKDYETADSYFQHVLDLTAGAQFEQVSTTRELAFFYLGESALDRGYYDEAVGYFKAAIRMNRSASNYYFGLGMALKGIEELAGAIDNFEIALTFDPKYAQAHYELGQAYLLQEDRVSAAVHFAEAARLAPDNELPIEALASLGTVEQWESRAREALATADNKAALEAVIVARVLVPDDADLAVLHGAILEADDQPGEALEVYREALVADPSNDSIKAAISRLEDAL